MMHALGAVTSYRDSQKDFYETYHLPYLAQKKSGKPTGSVKHFVVKDNADVVAEN